MVRNDKIAGFALLMLFSAALIMALGFPVKAASYVLLVNSIGIFLSICLIISAFIRGAKGKDKKVPQLSATAINKIIVITTAMFIYVFSMRIVGYMLSTIVFLVGTILYLHNGKNDKRQVLIATVIATVCAVLIYYIFGKLLYIPLPKGKIF